MDGYYNLALEAAREAGDHLQAASALAHTAFIPAANNGFSAALDYIHAAAQHVSKHPDGRLPVMTWIRRAPLLASLQSSSGTRGTRSGLGGCGSSAIRCSPGRTQLRCGRWTSRDWLDVPRHTFSPVFWAVIRPWRRYADEGWNVWPVVLAVQARLGLRIARDALGRNAQGVQEPADRLRTPRHYGALGRSGSPAGQT